MIRYKKCILNGLILLICTLLLNNVCNAQQKYEREYSIKPNTVPKRALDFIQSVFKSGKVHWYGEESLKGKSIEAKLKSSNKRYSIEFDSDGKIEDVEILISFKDIPSDVQVVIRKNLKNEFKKYKISKSQSQWTGTEKALKEAISTNNEKSAVSLRYELVVKARRNSLTKYFEVLCKSSGDIVSIHEIIQRNSDNLIY